MVEFPTVENIFVDRRGVTYRIKADHELSSEEKRRAVLAYLQRIGPKKRPKSGSLVTISLEPR